MEKQIFALFGQDKNPLTDSGWGCRLEYKLSRLGLVIASERSPNGHRY